MVLSLIVVLGCSGSRSSTAPSRQGQIQLTVSPTAVSYAGGAGVGGAICPRPFTSRWGPYVLNIQETGGVAITITSLRLVVTTVAGNQESDEVITSGISQDFTGTPAPALRMPANSSASSRPLYDCERETNGRPDFPGGTAVYTASGTDDEGRPVSSTATLTLLPPP
jgi:hypothetical protein